MLASHSIVAALALFCLLSSSGRPRSFVQAAVAHTHEKSQKERMEDGSYMPRDSHHHDQDDHHNTEFDHEAILGSVKEAEEFHRLSPSESIKRLKVLVKRMDTNSDGFVDRHEMKAWILRSFESLAKEEADERFEEMDTDHNEMVSWAEYMEETYQMGDPSLVLAAELHQPMVIEDRLMFEAADLDQDNSLTADEFVAFVSPEEFAHMLPVILKQTLKDKDHNRNDKIEFSEFIGDSASSHDKAWLIAEKQRFDEELDLDRDGYLNGNEILAWVVPSNEDVASDETDHLFAAADEDHDLRLSYQEIIDNHDTFVGSEATDYGDHLQNLQHAADEL